VKRLKTALLGALVAVLSFAQSGSPLTNPEVRRIGEQLLCLCGCGSTVTSCNMQHCHFSDPAREKLLTMVNAGMGEKEILAAFVKENGLRVLVKPPAEGFNLVGWVMPVVGLAAGFAVVWFVIRRFRRPAPAGAPPVDDAVLARYQQRIDRDLDRLE
jgi:cytochrome c-type biogenesis protein CcmH